MQKGRKGLGRGLSALIPDADMDFLTRVARGDDTYIDPSKTSKSKKPSSGRPRAIDTPTSAHTRSGTADQSAQLSQDYASHTNELKSLAELVPLSQIIANPYQPRRSFSDEEMQELSASIRQHGVLQPVLLRPLDINTAESPDNEVQYQLIAGERRWRASKIAGLSEIPAIVRRVTDQQALELAVIENVQRHDISALDAANAYRRLIQEFSLSQDEVAQRVGKSRASIANTIRLLDLPTEVQKAISDGALSEGHGRAILLAASDGARRAVFRRILRDKLSVRAAEELARVLQAEPDSVTAAQEDSSSAHKNTSHSLPEIRRIEEGLQKQLGTRVRIRPRKRGGQVVIQYFSHEELERVVKTILRNR
jgi:ParB family chromosome partitioning protein